MASSFIRNVPLSPAVTGALLYALTKSPEKYRQQLLQRLSQHLSHTNIARAITTLKWLFALGIARNFHIFLSELAQNNFRLRSERSKYDWPKEVAVVTGAASGFGALIAKGLAAKGVNVMAVDVRDGLPDDMKNNGKIHYYKCDLRDRQAVMDLASHIREDHGDPSILVNNAGVVYNHTILDASEKALRQLFDVNIVSHYWTLQAFLPAMIEKHKGHVVSTASMASFLSGPGIIPYCNTKAAVLSLHEGIQQEMRAIYNAPEIKWTIVHPTYASTPMLGAFEDKVKDAKVTILDPNTVANAVVNQIMSGRGKQLILGAEIGWLAGSRGWPHWFTQMFVHLTDGALKKVEKGKEIAGVNS